MIIHKDPGRYQGSISRTKNNNIDYYIGRSESDSPEVDNEIIITGKEMKIGSFYDIRVTDATEFDLMGKMIE